MPLAQAQYRALGLQQAYAPVVKDLGKPYVARAKTQVSARRAEKCDDKCVSATPRAAPLHMRLQADREARRIMNNPSLNTFTPDQRRELMVFLLTTAMTMGLCGIQARMEFAACTQTLMRHDSAEMLMLSDLFVWQVRNVGAAAFLGLGMFSDRDKTNKSGQLEWSGAIRHKEPLHCAIGSIAMFLFYRWQVERSAVPDFSSRAAWYFDCLSPGRKSARARCAKTTFADVFKAGLEHLGLIKTHFLHFMRVFGVFLASEHHVHRDSVLLIGRWLRDKLAVHYQKTLKPADGLVGMAGFAAGSPALCDAYRVPRGEIEPPAELLALVFPWRQAELEAVTARNNAARAAPNDETAAAGADRQAQAFLSEVLPYLENVLLQDCALLQDVVRAAHRVARRRRYAAACSA